MDVKLRSWLTIKTPDQRKLHCLDVAIENFGHISQLF